MPTVMRRFKRWADGGMERFLKKPWRGGREGMRPKQAVGVPGRGGGNHKGNDEIPREHGARAGRRRL